MINIIISLAIIAVLLLRLLPSSDKIRKNAYKWWYIPWAGVLYTLLIFTLYRTLSLSAWPVFRPFVQVYQLEAVVSLAGILIWTIAILPFLKKESIYNSLTSIYRTVFAGNRSDKSKILPFPYHIDTTGTVRGHVGHQFYRGTVKVAAIVLAMIYVLYFAALYLFTFDFYLISSFGLLALIPITDYYIYLCSEVTPEEDIPIEQRGIEIADFEKLWKWYVEVFDNYSVAWMLKGFDPRKIKQQEDNNNDEVSDLIGSFIGSHMDGIIEDCNLTDAFKLIDPLLNWTAKNGKIVLVAFDIPHHFTGNHQSSYVDKIASNLRTMLHKEILVYNENTPRAALNSSIVIAPLTMLSRNELDSEWLGRIGLITVVNLFDKGISNLYECRKFCFLLQSVNKDYQFLFINPYRRGAEPSLRNTWVTGNNVIEKKLTQFLHADSQFYIGYNFEDYKYRFNKILASKPSEPLYSGLELAPIALSSKLRDEVKPQTPVHYLDLAYTNAIEGKEELGKFRSQLKEELLKVSAVDINQNVVNHVLPVEEIKMDNLLAVIFDQENNAPAAYAKWKHLGEHENFSIVVSRPYLFRDYFNANLDYFVSAPFTALQPHLSKSRVTLAIILLEILRKTRVEEWQLRDLIRYYYDDREVKSVSEIIRQLFDCYFASSIANTLKASFSVSFEDGKYYHDTWYKLDNSDNNQLSFLDLVSVQDESGNIIFEILRDLLYQNYESGQIHSFSGKPYVIKEYDVINRTLKVSASNNTDDDVAFNRPVLEVTVSGDRTPIKEIECLNYGWSHPITDLKLSISFQGFETNVSIRNKKWYTFHRYSIVGADYFTTDSHSPERVYTRGKVLKVSMRYLPKQEYLYRIDDIRKSFQILLYEAMQSVFPQHAQYLVIASQGEGDSNLPWIFNSFHVNDQPEEGVLSYYFIEDAHIDLGLIGVLSNRDNFSGKYLFRYIYDYLIWLTEGEPTEAEGYHSYLNGKNQDKYSFLKYGRDTLPAYFDVDLLINFLRDFFCDNDQSLQRVGVNRSSRHDSIGACDFCGVRMKNSEMQRLSDGRMRCPECSIDAIDTDKQFVAMQEIAHNLFLKYLGIDFKSIPHKAKLISAVELHKAMGEKLPITNGYDARKYLGFANWSNDYYVENGQKPVKTLSVTIHELTHIWQFSNEPFLHLYAENSDWLEGLAVWTDLFLTDKYLQEKDLNSVIEEERNNWLSRKDEYGRGLKLVLDTCPDDPYGFIKSQ